MNFINEFTSAIGAGSIAGYVLVGMYGLILLLALIGALKGLTRGAVSQTVRLITVAGSAVISYVICLKVFPLISGKLEGKTLGEALEMLKLGSVLDNLGKYKDVISGVDAETAQYLTALPISIIVLPLLFVLAFIIISALMLIIHAILCAVLGANGKRSNPVSRLLGFLLGAGQGAAVGALLLIPIVSLSSFAKTGMAEFSDGNSLKSAYTNYVEEAADSELVGLIQKCGGDYVVKGFNTITIEEEKTDISESARSLFVAYGKISTLKGVDFKKLTKSEQTVIRETTDLIKDDNYLTTLFAGILRNAATVFKTNPSLLPMDNPTVKDMLCEFIAIFESTTAKDVGADLTTIENVYFILCDTGTLNAATAGDQDAIINAMTVKDPVTGQSVIEQIIDELEKNEHTASLVSTMARFAISVMMGEMDDETRNLVEMYENMKDSLQEDVLSLKRDDFASDEEYAEEVAQNLTEVLAANNIEIPAEVSENMADYIVENIDVLGAGDLSDADISSIFLQYFEAAK